MSQVSVSDVFTPIVSAPTVTIGSKPTNGYFTWIVVIILIAFLLFFTWYAVRASRIPGNSKPLTYGSTFVSLLLATLFGSFIIYAVVNLILRPYLGFKEIAYTTAILYYIIIIIAFAIIYAVSKRA